MTANSHLSALLLEDEKVVMKATLISGKRRIGLALSLATVLGIALTDSWLAAGAVFVLLGGFWGVHYHRVPRHIILTHQRLLWLSSLMHHPPTIKEEHSLQEVVGVHINEPSQRIQLTLNNTRQRVFSVRGYRRARQFARRIAENAAVDSGG